MIKKINQVYTVLIIINSNNNSNKLQYISKDMKNQPDTFSKLLKGSQSPKKNMRAK